MRSEAEIDRVIKGMRRGIEAGKHLDPEGISLVMMQTVVDALEWCAGRPSCFDAYVAECERIERAMRAIDRGAAN